MIAKTVPSALVIPQAALLTSPSGATSVIVIDPENKPHKQHGHRRHPRRGQVQITDGLESGQRVATTGAFELAKLDPTCSRRRRSRSSRRRKKKRRRKRTVDRMPDPPTNGPIATGSRATRSRSSS